MKDTYIPSKITFAYDCLLAAAEVLTASSAVPTMPVDNLRNQMRGEFWRTTGCAEETLYGDLGEDKLFKIFYLVEHNFTPDCTIRIQANTENDFSSPPYDETFNVADPVFGFGEEGLGEKGLGGFYVEPEGKIAAPFVKFLNYDENDNSPCYRYIKITIKDPANPDGYLEAGILDIADYIESERNYQWKNNEKLIDPSTVSQSQGGVDWENEEEMYVVRRLSIGAITDSQRQFVFKKFFFSVGKTRNFILVLKPFTALGRALTAHYGKFTADMDFIDVFVDNNDIEALEFKEVL